MRPLLLAALLTVASAHGSRTLLTAPAPLGGAFNKNPALAAWTSQQISYINQFTVTNVGNAGQNVSVTAYIESLVWQEFNSSSSIVNALPIPAQITFGGYGAYSSAGAATWNATDSRYELTLGSRSIAAGKASTFDAVLRFRGPVGHPATTPHVIATGSIRFKVDITEDRGAITAAHRVFGNNGFGACSEDSNMMNLSPVFYPVNGGRPF